MSTASSSTGCVHIKNGPHFSVMTEFFTKNEKHWYLFHYLGERGTDDGEPLLMYFQGHLFTAISGFSTFKRAAALLPRSGTGLGIEAFTGSDDFRFLNGLRQKTGFSISRLSLAQQTLYNALYRLILS